MQLPTSSSRPPFLLLDVCTMNASILWSSRLPRPICTMTVVILWSSSRSPGPMCKMNVSILWSSSRSPDPMCTMNVVILWSSSRSPGQICTRNMATLWSSFLLPSSMVCSCSGLLLATHFFFWLSVEAGISACTYLFRRLIFKTATALKLASSSSVLQDLSPDVLPGGVDDLVVCTRSASEPKSSSTNVAPWGQRYVHSLTGVWRHNQQLICLEILAFDDKVNSSSVVTDRSLMIS